MAFVTITTITAGFQMIQRFLVMGKSPIAAESFKGYLNVFLILPMIVCVAIILTEAVRRWINRPPRSDAVPSGEAAQA